MKQIIIMLIMAAIILIPVTTEDFTIKKCADNSVGLFFFCSFDELFTVYDSRVGYGENSYNKFLEMRLQNVDKYRR